ncbi:MAG TPA: hypothetical protein VGC24_08925 [Burkholderiaceae bacterium]
MPPESSPAPLLCALLAAALLGGCGSTPPQEPATLPPPPPPSVAAAPAAPTPAVPTPPAPPRIHPATPAPQDGNALLAYADRLRAMAQPELGQEIQRLSDLGEEQRGPFPNMQLALALGQTHANGDLQRAQTLVQRTLTNPSEDARPLWPLARLLAARYGEQRRVEEQLDRQSQQLRDSQRRIDQLNERLEAVRAIERSLTSRPGHSTPSRAAP